MCGCRVVCSEVVSVIDCLVAFPQYKVEIILHTDVHVQLACCLLHDSDCKQWDEVRRLDYTLVTCWERPHNACRFPSFAHVLRLAKAMSSRQDLSCCVQQLESKTTILEKENEDLRRKIKMTRTSSWKGEDGMEASLASSKEQTEVRWRSTHRMYEPVAINLNKMHSKSSAQNYECVCLITNEFSSLFVWCTHGCLHFTPVSCVPAAEVTPSVFSADQLQAFGRLSTRVTSANLVCRHNWQSLVFARLALIVKLFHVDCALVLLFCAARGSFAWGTMVKSPILHCWGMKLLNFKSFPFFEKSTFIYSNFHQRNTLFLRHSPIFIKWIHLLEKAKSGYTKQEVTDVSGLIHILRISTMSCCVQKTLCSKVFLNNYYNLNSICSPAPVCWLISRQGDFGRLGFWQPAELVAAKHT